MKTSVWYEKKIQRSKKETSAGFKDEDSGNDSDFDPDVDSK